MKDRSYALVVLASLVALVLCAALFGATLVKVWYHRTPVAQTVQPGQRVTLRVGEQAFLLPAVGWDSTTQHWWLSSDEEALGVSQLQQSVEAYGISRGVTVCMATSDDYMRMVGVLGARQEYSLNPSEATLRRMQNLEDEWRARRRAMDPQFCALVEVTP